jgi:hypothetical protein
MGMLFNTPATLEILAVLNYAFNQSRFNELQNANHNGIAWATSLVTKFNGVALGTTGSYGAINSHPLYVDFDNNATSGKYLSGRWVKWLKHLDSTSVSRPIAAEIVASIGDTTNCKSIEYYAVPGTSVSSVIMFWVPGNAPVTVRPATPYITIITVTTDIVDNIAGTVVASVFPGRHHRKRKAAPRMTR